MSGIARPAPKPGSALYLFPGVPTALSARSLYTAPATPGPASILPPPWLPHRLAPALQSSKAAATIRRTHDPLPHQNISASCTGSPPFSTYQSAGKSIPKKGSPDFAAAFRFVSHQQSPPSKSTYPVTTDIVPQNFFSHTHQPKGRK